MAGPISFEDLFSSLGPGAKELQEFTTSIQGLNRNYRAFAKNLDKDAERINGGLSSIQAAVAGVKAQLAGANVGNEQQRSGISALAAEVARLAKEQDSYKRALEGQNTIRRTTKAATDELTKSLREQQDALKKAYAEGNVEGAKTAAIRVMELKRQTDQLSKAMRGVNSDFTAVSGSYNRLSLDTQKLGDRIRALPGGFEATSKEANELKKQFSDNTQKLKDFDRELNQNFREVGAYAKGILEAVAALEKQRGSLQANIGALQQQQRATGLTSEQQDRLQKEIRETETELGKVNNQLKTYGVQSSQASGFTTGLQKSAGGLAQSFAGAFYGIQGLANGIQQLFEKNVQYSDQAADVRKATGQSAEEFEDLADALKKVDTRTTLAGQLDIAKVGGQLGKTKDEIEDFTKSIDVAVQALGDDFSGGAEQIATELGKIEVVFRKTLGPDQNQNLINIGSAINQLGAEGAATAPFLSDVALRVGATAANARLGLKDVLAYASVLQETGFSAEVSGTALNRLFNTLSVRTQESFAIAKLADSNLTLKDFKNLINNDFQGAINIFLKGLNTGGKTTTEFNKLLATLKLQSGEAKSAITTLAKNTDLFAERQKSANSQLELGTSLAEEAAIKNDNLAGSVEKTKNAFINFVTNGTVANGLKILLDGTRERVTLLTDGLAKLGEGVEFIGRKIGAVKPPPPNQFGDLGNSTKSLLEQSKAADKLLASYQKLSSTQIRSAAQEQQLADIALKLQKNLGVSVVSLDKETGKYKLNTGAVEDAIFARRALAVQNEKDLTRYVRNAENAVASTQKLQAILTSSIGDAQAKLDLSGLSAARRKELEQAVRDRAALREEFGAGATETQATQTFSQKELNAAQALIDAEDRLKANGELLKRQQKDLANAQNALNGVRKAGVEVIKDETVNVDNSVDKDKKKKDSIADIAKAEYELQKQRLEAKRDDFVRQSENPANTEEIRLRATQKAAQTRRELAKLERDELIREAAQTYKGQIGGQIAYEKTRIRLQEAFKDQLLAINRDLSKEEKAIRDALLDQLGEVDKLQLEQEIATLERISADENKSYQERQDAAFAAAARRIEIIEIEGQAKVRAAKGNAEELAKIEAELEQKRNEALAKPQSFNSDFANTDALKGYEQQQLALERNRADGLVTERAYQKELRKLEDDYLALKLSNLEKDSSKQREAAQLELEIARRKNQQLLDEERRMQELRGELIIEGLQNVQQLSDSFFQIGANRREQELSDLTQKKDAELQIAGENEELKAQIEETYRKRELAIRQRQAKADKAAALFNVALNTAMAVTSVLSTGGGTRYADFGISAGILSALVIAQGIAQAVAIASKPIPQYFKGREGGPAEWAMVGDRGAELVSTTSGKAQLFSQPTITYLPQGATVHTATQTNEILRENRFVENRLLTRSYQNDLHQRTVAIEKPTRPVVDPVARIAEAARRDTDRLITALYEKPEQRLTENGLRTYTRRGNHTTEHINRKYKRNG
ncbi:phage tail tape measure protein [Hymenobacter sp. YC55]|uniref:phage tail tape measure protein n=1 Tax=Hymenobacter sp. YC55 TaxID=3034019 RepID=UPI0023F83E19|nr:phage tail tape measure protein [Hymenobacter sp. YC55]MDF7810701.1 phage tail tape measure protein [Hymenobacter sp. YC55]